MMELATIHQTETALTREQVDLLKRTVAKNATDDEFALFIQLCKARGLDPFCRQIHFTKNGTITGIDGFRVIAERTGKYCPGDTEYIEDANGNLIAARVSVRKRVGDDWFTVTETAYLSEYKANTPIWQKMPRVMIAKCAESRSLRRAFPSELSGLYTQEEMEQAEHPAQPPRPVVVAEIPSPEPPKPEPTVIDLGDRIAKSLSLFNHIGIPQLAMETYLNKAIQEWDSDDLRRLGMVWKQAEQGSTSYTMKERLDIIMDPDGALAAHLAEAGN